MSGNQQQNNLWQTRTNQQVKAELCNVLYERELARLASEQSLSLNALRKKIHSLPYYIGRAADSIGSIYSPLDLDSSNASWLGPQSASPLSSKQDPEKCAQFYEKNAQFALVVPIAISVFGIEHVVLDTIDDIDMPNGRLHCNQNGWFSISGHYLNDESEGNDAQMKFLLKPSKQTFTAACCGHQWKGKNKTTARALSLRELLLATRINWHSFGKLLAPKKQQV